MTGRSGGRVKVGMILERLRYSANPHRPPLRPRCPMPKQRPPGPSSEMPSCLLSSIFRSPTKSPSPIRRPIFCCYLISCSSLPVLTPILQLIPAHIPNITPPYPHPYPPLPKSRSRPDQTLTHITSIRSLRQMGIHAQPRPIRLRKPPQYILGRLVDIRPARIFREIVYEWYFG